MPVFRSGTGIDDEMVKLKRGFDIKLLGEADRQFLDVDEPSLFAIKPSDIAGASPIPKLQVDVGDEIRAGQSICFDKQRPEVLLCAPVSGEIVDVRRGQRRAVDEVVILADGDIDFHEFKKVDSEKAPRGDLVALMLESGAWALLKQRPFDTVPDPAVIPRDIFISCFDTAPLAPDYGVLMEGKGEAFENGIRALRRLTEGHVHLGVSPDSDELFTKADGVQVHSFSGPHPAGNVGVHIHHSAPVNKGEVVWTIKPQDVAIIGRLFTSGIFDAQRTVALVGSEVEQTGYYRTRIGASINKMIEGNLRESEVRFISGNVLTGKRISSDGFVGLFDDQVSVIKDSDTSDFLGWLFPTEPSLSMSRSFPSFLFPNRQYRANSDSHGEERAFVMTGQYEKVVPMDLYPQFLTKSILVEDFDQMEALGIYEVVEEDLALCEFVCTSKQPVQQILRRGLDAIRIEG